MDSCSQATGDGAGDRYGGKILKRKRIRRTPYDQPPPPTQPESPNWYNGLVYPAKFVAGGASKLISSFWNPKSWGSHSSSSDNDSDSERGDVEDDSEDNANLSDGGVELNQNKGSSLVKSEILYLVEQLLMLEHYSREECARLTEIINSRVIDYTTRDIGDAGPSKIPSRTDNESPDIRNQAIMEARKLITENMVGSNSKSYLDNHTHGSKSLTTPNRDHLSAGSCNIQYEKRRLRAKATEDMLSSHQSQKLTAVTAEHDHSDGSLANANVLNPNDQKPEDENMNLASEVGNLGFSDMRTILDDIPANALSSLPTIEEHNKTTEEPDDASNSEQNHRGNRMSENLNRFEGNCDFNTESTEVPDVNEAAIDYIIGCQGSSNTDDPSAPRKFDNPHVTRSATRGGRYGRRGRARGK